MYLNKNYDNVIHPFWLLIAWIARVRKTQNASHHIHPSFAFNRFSKCRPICVCMCFVVYKSLRQDILYVYSSLLRGTARARLDIHRAAICARLNVDWTRAPSTTRFRNEFVRFLRAIGEYNIQYERWWSCVGAFLPAALVPPLGFRKSVARG